jgi:polysaccharide export outer membrane protein
MKLAVVFVCVLAGLLAGCSWFPGQGPSTNEVLEQGQVGNEILFDVVEVNDRVVSTVLAQPKESFARRFKGDVQPPEVKIAVGDTISVLIWESAAGGLFSEAPSLPPTTPGIEPLAPEAAPPVGELQGERGAPRLPSRRPSGASNTQQGQSPAGNPPTRPFSIEAVATSGRRPALIPDQEVDANGDISIPYAGRIPAAGRLPTEVQQTIEARLARKALEPQALVIVTKSAANAVTVAGEAGLAQVAAVAGQGIDSATDTLPQSGGAQALRSGAAGYGARIPLSPGGNRLLEVIAAAGGPRAPVHDTFVRLSRDGVAATIPFQRLVSDPAENIYAQPGDVLTLVQIPQTFSVFGATGRNAEIPIGAEKISLGEALGKSQGLDDNLAKPEGVFLFRYEPNSIVRALGQPIATAAAGEVSPVVYRFNLREAETYLLAQKFPVHDKDVIFVADAPAAQIYKFFTALNNITGPFITGIVTCHYANC